jgi:hypothetical protein
MKQHMSIFPLIFEHEFGFGEGNGDSGGISVNKIPFSIVASTYTNNNSFDCSNPGLFIQNSTYSQKFTYS